MFGRTQGVFSAYVQPLDVAGQQISPFLAQNSILTNGAWLKFQKAPSSVSLRAPLSPSVLLSLFKWLNTTRLSVQSTVSLALRLEWVEPRPCCPVLSSARHITAQLTSLGWERGGESSFIRCFSSEPSFALILFTGHRNGYPSPDRFYKPLVDSSSFSVMYRTLVFSWIASAAVSMAWIVLVLKGVFQKCLGGCELLVMVLSVSVLPLCFVTLIFKRRINRLCSLKFIGFNWCLG